MGAASSVASRRPLHITLPRRFYRTWSRASQGPPPILQLTFHNEYDCMKELKVTPELYFRVRRPLYSIPTEELLEKGDGDSYLLSAFSKWFLRSSALLVHGNHNRGYCIAPSFNLDVWLATGNCALKTAKWFYLGESVNSKVMTIVTAYEALAQYFITMLKQAEGPDIMQKLSPIVKDLLEKMAGEISDPRLIKFIEDVILNHPAMMSTDGCIYLIQQAERVLKKELLCGGEGERAVADRILSSQAYLWSDTVPISAADPCRKGAWVAIALKHVALRHWYEFSLKQNAKSGIMSAKSRAIRIKKGRHLAQAAVDLAYSGATFVALWRNGGQHYAEMQLKAKLLEALKSSARQGTTDKEIREKLAKIWPIKKKVLIATFIINYPLYLPVLIESFLRARKLKSLGLYNCWPRHPRSYGHTPPRIAGFNVFLLKLGLRHAYQDPSPPRNDDGDRQNKEGLHNYEGDNMRRGFDECSTSDDSVRPSLSIDSKPNKDDTGDDDLEDENSEAYDSMAGNSQDPSPPRNDDGDRQNKEGLHNYEGDNMRRGFDECSTSDDSVGNNAPKGRFEDND